MVARIEKIKTHFRNNKKTYLLCGCTALLTAVGTTLVVKRPGTFVETKFFTKQTGVVNKTTNVEVHIEALGDPGNIIQDATTGTVYASQNQAARELGVNRARISEHLNGRISDVNGHVLEKLGKAPVAG